ncbi:MAG TPA: CAP domain-containing protein [Mycobacteriales bacterium]|nr:CAP domain-containing protein [Mycobacteriales bacterium]
MNETTNTAPASRRGAALAVLGVLLGLLPLGLIGTAPAHAASTVDGVRLNGVEAKLVELINVARTSRGIPRLAVASGATDVARRWAATQATQRRMYHNPNYAAQLTAAGSPQWRAAAENVGTSSDPVSLFNAYMSSPGHRENILSRSYRYIGIGWAELPDHRGYNTQNFIDSYSATYGPTREPAYGGLLDTRTVVSPLRLADFESGRDPRVFAAVTGAGMTVGQPVYDAPGPAEGAARFVARQVGAGTGGAAEMRLREALDLTRATAIKATVGAVTKTGRPLQVVVAVRTAFGGTVSLGTMTVPSGKNITATLALPAAARGWRNEVVISVSRAALTALDPAAYTGRQATVYVRDLTITA